MAKPTETSWEIDPHTTAKHEVLKRYLEAWFPILKRTIDHPQLIARLAGGFLPAHPKDPARRNTGAGRSVALRTVLDSTSLFPFRLSPVSADHLVAVSLPACGSPAQAGGRLDVLRHGLGQDLITLRGAL